MSSSAPAAKPHQDDASRDKVGTLTVWTILWSAAALFFLIRLSRQWQVGPVQD